MCPRLPDLEVYKPGQSLVAVQWLLSRCCGAQAGSVCLRSLQPMQVFTPCYVNSCQQQAQQHYNLMYSGIQICHQNWNACDAVNSVLECHQSRQSTSQSFRKGTSYSERSTPRCALLHRASRNEYLLLTIGKVSVSGRCLAQFMRAMNATGKKMSKHVAPIPPQHLQRDLV